MDAGIRLCARSADVWSLALPGGAAVAAAVTFFVEGVVTRRHVALSCALLTAAWFVRSLFQGAAAHHAEAVLTQPDAPSMRASLVAALKHAPSLFIAAGTLLFVNLISLSFTLGFAIFFMSAHVAGYAVAMKDAGHPLAIVGTCSRVLGPARGNTPGVRVALWMVGLVAVNLHIAANVLIFLGRKIGGLELTFLQRYASLDNPVWDVAMAALAFALLDPLRAAVGAILVVDGRVRQDGLDLQSAISQLPKRKSRVAATAALILALFAPRAEAQKPEKGSNAELRARLHEVVVDCAGDDPDLLAQVDRVDDLGSREHAPLSRFVAELERLDQEEDDCDSVNQRLETGLPLIVEVADKVKSGEAPDPGSKAKEILARPEFLEAPAVTRPPEPAPKEDAAKPDESSFWKRFLKWLSELLKKWLERDPASAPPALGSPGSGSVFAWLLIGVLALGAVGLILWLALRTNEAAKQQQGQVEVAAVAGNAADASAGALARAPDAWAHLADELAAQGNFREAIRHLYLAVLSRLHGAGAIDYDPGLSNWDYLRRFRGTDAWRSDFKELTFRFDYAFYGKQHVSVEAYARFRGAAGRILAEEAAGAARA